MAFYHAVHRGVKKLKLNFVALPSKHITIVAASTIIVLIFFWMAVMNVSSYANTNVTKSFSLIIMDYWRYFFIQDGSVRGFTIYYLSLCTMSIRANLNYKLYIFLPKNSEIGSTQCATILVKSKLASVDLCRGK